MSKVPEETNPAEYVGVAMRSRLDDLALLQRAVDRAEDFSWGDMANLEGLGASSEEDLAREAEERLDEMPLAVETRTLFEIVLGTNGPDDRLIVECNTYDRSPTGYSETAYEIRRIIYRYSWAHESGERVLSVDDSAVAERFARQVVPELGE